jgi:hypothetical protein
MNKEILLNGVIRQAHYKLATEAPQRTKSSLTKKIKITLWHSTLQ